MVRRAICSCLCENQLWFKVVRFALGLFSREDPFSSVVFLCSRFTHLTEKGDAQPSAEAWTKPASKTSSFVLNCEKVETTRKPIDGALVVATWQSIDFLYSVR